MHSYFPYVVVSAAVLFAAGCDDPPERTLSGAGKQLSHQRSKQSLLDRSNERGLDLEFSGEPNSTASANPPKSGLLDFGAPDLFSPSGGSKATGGGSAASFDPRLIEVQTVDANYKAAFQRGEEFLKNGKLDQALASFDEAKRVDSKNYLAYLGEALCYYQKQDVGSALAAIDFAIRYAPDQSLLYSYRSQIRARQANYHGAIDDMTVALKQHPRDPAALSMRAQFHAQVGNHPAAIADFTAALRERPGEVAWLFSRAVAYFHAQHFKEAVADATAVLAREPKLPDASFLRAVARFRLRELDAGRADYDEAVRNGLNPRTADQWRSAFYPGSALTEPK